LNYSFTPILWPQRFLNSGYFLKSLLPNSPAVSSPTTKASPLSPRSKTTMMGTELSRARVRLWHSKYTDPATSRCRWFQTPKQVIRIGSLQSIFPELILASVDDTCCYSTSLLSMW